MIDRSLAHSQRNCTHSLLRKKSRDKCPSAKTRRHPPRWGGSMRRSSNWANSKKQEIFSPFPRAEQGRISHQGGYRELLSGRQRNRHSDGAVSGHQGLQAVVPHRSGCSYCRSHRDCSAGQDANGVHRPSRNTRTGGELCGERRGLCLPPPSSLLSQHIYSFPSSLGS